MYALRNTLYILVVSGFRCHKLLEKMPSFSQNKAIVKRSKSSKGSFGRCICRPSHIAAAFFAIILLLVVVFRFHLNPVLEMKGLQGFTSNEIAKSQMLNTLEVHVRNSNSNSIPLVTEESSTQRIDFRETKTSEHDINTTTKTLPPKQLLSKNKGTKASIIAKSNAKSKAEKKSSNGKRQKKKKDWLYDGVYNLEPYWGVENKTYIRVIPSEKIPLKWERMILFPSNITIDKNKRPNEPPSGVVGRPRDLSLAEEFLQRHPLRQGLTGSTLEEVIFALQKGATCIDKPIFLTVCIFSNLASYILLTAVTVFFRMSRWPQWEKIFTGSWRKTSYIH